MTMGDSMAYTGNRSQSLMTFARTSYWPVASADLGEAWKPRAKQLLETVLNGLGHVRLADLDARTVAVWWAEARNRGRSPRSANLLLIRLRHIVKVARTWGLLDSDPTEGLRPAKEPRNRVRYFESPEQRRALFDAAAPALRDFITIAHYTGARRRSVWALEAGDVDFTRGLIRFKATKNGDDHSVPIHPALEPVLRRRCHTTGRMFPEYTNPHSVSTAWRRLCKRHGITGFRLHDLRHDTASVLVSRGVSLKAVQEILGHKTAAMTNRYAHLAPGAVREAVAVL